jgi:hypothetical protein
MNDWDNWNDSESEETQTDDSASDPSYYIKAKRFSKQRRTPRTVYQV